MTKIPQNTSLDASSPEGRYMDQRREHLRLSSIRVLSDKYHKTGDKKYLLQLERLGVMTDYIAGYDDGEMPNNLNHNEI